MKLRLLLESFDPRRFLLHAQQLVVDEYPDANVEINCKIADSYELEVKYFDIKPVTVSLYKEDDESPWMISFHGAMTLYPTSFDEHGMTPINSLRTVETMLKRGFEAGVVFEDNCQEYFTGDSEKWVYAEIDKLFEYLGTGRLKKAADVHIVVSTILDDEGLQKLETRYNSTLINSKKLRLSSSSAPNPSDYRARLHEAYILANLE